jgi:hypothetical protein
LQKLQIFNRCRRKTRPKWKKCVQILTHERRWVKYIGFASSGSEDLFAVLDTRISTQPKIYNIFMIYSWCIHHMFSIYSSYSRHIFTNSSFITYPCDIHLIYPYIYISIRIYSLYIYICYYIKQIQIHKYLYPSYINPPTTSFPTNVPLSKGFVEPFWDSFTRASCY